jgi:hypothetical protein
MDGVFYASRADALTAPVVDQSTIMPDLLRARPRHRSYNDGLRGAVEDAIGRQRRVRCALPSCGLVGDVIDGSALLATGPEIVASQIRRTRPHLRPRPLPFAPFAQADPSLGPELLWPAATDDDPACQFVREQVLAIARAANSASSSSGARRSLARTRASRLGTSVIRAPPPTASGDLAASR